MARASRFVLRVTLPLLVLLGSTAARAAITTYTDKAAFKAALNTGYYETTDMSTVYITNGGTFSQVGGNFSYTIGVSPQTANEQTGQIIFTSQEYQYDFSPFGGPANASLTFSLGPHINAFGGYLYPADDGGNLATGSSESTPSVTLSINDGSYAWNLTPSSREQSFFGIISTGYLNNAVLTASSSAYPTVGNVIVGEVPGPLPIAGGCFFFHWSRRLRRRITMQGPTA